MKRSVVVLLGAMSVAGQAQAWDVAGVTVGGESNIEYASFANGNTASNFGVSHDEFNLANTRLRLSKDAEKWAFDAQITLLDDAAAGSTTNTRIYPNLYRLEMFYKPMQNLAIGGGRLMTTLGYESTFRFENKNYSNSLIYNNYNADTYEGVRVKYTMPDLFAGVFSVYNRAAADNRLDEDNRMKAYELSLTGKAGMVNWFVGALQGRDTSAGITTENSNINAWVALNPMENTSVALDFDSQSTKDTTTTGAEEQKVTAINAILGYQFDIHGLALRYENVNDDKGRLTSSGGAATKYSNITLTDKIALDPNMELSLEYRMDSADREIYTKDDGTATKTANAFIAGVTAHF